MNTRGKVYKTRQKEDILNYLQNNIDTHVTIAHISEYFKTKGSPVGLTTIYRYMDVLVKAGIVEKFNIEGEQGAFFQMAKSKAKEESDIFHFKCTDCGSLVHFQCDDLHKLYYHMMSDHGFNIDLVKTVYYGRCNNCEYNVNNQ